jgi:hypothetical protein
MRGMKDFSHTISVIHDITICYDWDTEMLLELIDAGEISFSREGLLIGSTMDSYEIGSSIF